MARSSRRERLFRDPVHDVIAFDETDPREALLVRLIDTPECQRLRRIRQLGMASLAFPGADHTRFSHVLGTLHIARRMLGELRKDGALDEDLSFACLCAALLHDIGHGPFSHIFERFLGQTHEERTVDIVLGEESQVNRELRSFDAALPERVAALVRGDKETGVYGDIIASQLDADRLDYLLRDSLMTGVKYGVYDLERILKMLRLDPAGQRIVMPAKALMPVEKYLQSRYHMYRQVYFHKAVTAAEVMLTSLLKCAAKKALKGGLPGAEDPDSRLARLLLRPRALSSGEFAQLDDAELLSLIKQWAGGEDPVMRDLSQRLLGRRLFKSIDVSHIEDPLDERLERGRDAVAGAGLDPHYYFLRIESSDTPYRPYDPGARGRGHAGPIYIQAPDGAVSDVEHLSPTISAFIHSAYTLTRIVFPEEANGVNLRETMRKIFQ